MDYVYDSLRAKYITLEEYDKARRIDSKLNYGYFSTNEYLNYIDKLDINNKNVLTVCGSGDQIFFSLLNNAKKVDTFDSNPLQYYIFELKKAAILNLNKEEYLNFFPLIGGNIYENYNIKYYEKIKNGLSEKARFFWDLIYSDYIGHIYLLNKISYSIKYESNYTRWYEELKDLLKNKKINYYNYDFYNIFNELDKNKYDIILLSNIYDHLTLHQNISTQDYIDYIYKYYFPLLKENGLCMCHYQFNGHKNISISNFNNSEIIKCSGGDYANVLKKR